MMTPTEPTPTPGDVRSPRDVLAAEFWLRIDTGNLDEDKEIAYARADVMLSALTDAGFTITRPEAGNNSILPQGLTWHECECCRTIFIADTDDDHLWAMEGCRVLCSTCYVAETHELVHQHLLEKYAKEKSNEPNQPSSAAAAPDTETEQETK